MTVRVLSEQGPVRVELARWGDRLVVVKRLRSFHPVASQRLEREAAVVGRLRHDNIVPLLGVSEGASLIYAYCPGVSLEAALERGPLRVRRAMKIAQDVLSALAYAHGQGVIHHDVKPANILVKGESALLTDFGFAKDLGLTAITAQDMLLGTPSYMAPEQFKGVRTDQRSDLYATGAVIYHMLTGAPPYGSQVVRWLAGDDRVPLAPLPDSAAAYRTIVERALSRDPSTRFASADDFLTALQEVSFGAVA
ncbi:MAG: serine/threonine-protein kinase [Truepera sp.]|nr:serine/threonine-protein kinase [Truepera sp.]